jgi:ABC-2 type transport system permease protein
VMERLYGPHGIRRFLKHELDRYLAARSGEMVEEMPLLRVENQPYVHYQKGALAMYLLKERIGEEAVNRALRNVLERYRFRAAPYPTSKTLVDALHAEAGPAHQQLVTDLFERITLYDLRVLSSHAVARPDGRFDVTMRIAARKLYADGLGAETDTSFAESDRIDVGLFLEKPGAEGFDGDDVVVLERVAPKGGEQELVFTVRNRPAYVGIDPYNMHVDRESDDNVVAIGE